MRTFLCASAAVVLTACGGNWSTRDLEFVNALPQRADLQARLPVVGSTSQPLEGVSTRKDGLNVGDPSQAYATTKKAATDFNGLLDQVLSILDTVRLYPPTTRSADGRVWGPYPDAKNEGFEFQVAIQQLEATRFAWSIQAQPRGGALFDVLTGTFDASTSAREGTGAFVVHVANFKDKLAVDPAMQSLDRIDVGYQTASWPRRVDMAFTFTPGNTSGLSMIGYTYRYLQDGRGALAYQVRTTSVEATVLSAIALWNTSGAGRAQAVVAEGTYTGATVSECWDTATKVVFYAESWPGGQMNGAVADCATIDGL